MSGLFTQVVNKIQYKISEWASDPKAEEYARQQEAQAKQETDVQARKQTAAEQANVQAAANAVAAARARDLASRSQFSPARASSNIVNGILNGFMMLIYILIAMYGGHLAANEAIGYNLPFRLLSFIYGTIFFFIVIPMSLYNTYWLNILPKYYTYLPLSTYEPKSDLAILFLGGFCYKEDQIAIDARNKVAELYKVGFEKSQIKPV
jgi:hypothetical protein